MKRRRVQGLVTVGILISIVNHGSMLLVWIKGLFL